MVIKISSKNQLTLPKPIAKALALHQGDFLEIEIVDNKIVLTPQEVIFEDKYPQADLEKAEKALARPHPGEEISFPSSGKMINHLKKRTK